MLPAGATATAPALRRRSLLAFGCSITEVPNRDTKIGACRDIYTKAPQPLPAAAGYHRPLRSATSCIPTATVYQLPPMLLLQAPHASSQGVCAGFVPGAKGGDLNANSAVSSWVVAAAGELDAEYSCVGYGRQGWTIGGNGNVPPFGEAWRSLWSGVARVFRFVRGARVHGHCRYAGLWKAPVTVGTPGALEMEPLPDRYLTTASPWPHRCLTVTSPLPLQLDHVASAGRAAHQPWL